MNVEGHAAIVYDFAAIEARWSANLFPLSRLEHPESRINECVNVMNA
jgi:hypothetical protein